jgi:hypothetical protein
LFRLHRENLYSGDLSHKPKVGPPGGRGDRWVDSVLVEVVDVDVVVAVIDVSHSELVIRITRLIDDL